ncbi:hypothetical protein JOL62DRAFT_561116 [Phyllosticta paracitricarpa]|uniref:Secreted protein n=1 Tax=Phyllosticta paracitricarpa TaxID=2016321 RepID=A0ABR1NJI4_9PEZI
MWSLLPAGLVLLAPVCCARSSGSDALLRSLGPPTRVTNGRNAVQSCIAPGFVRRGSDKIMDPPCPVPLSLSLSLCIRRCEKLRSQKQQQKEKKS